MRLFLLLLLAILCLSCGQKSPGLENLRKDLNKFPEYFTYQSLALSRVPATANGYHLHMGAALDEMLDDYSPEGLEFARKFYTGFRDKVATYDRSKLDKEQKADLDIMKNNIE